MRWGVLRNDQGKFQATFSEKFDDGTNNGIELQAMFSGVKLCKSLLFWHIFIEFDSELVMRWLTKRIYNAWYLWDFWDEVQEELQDIEFMANHIFRERNQIVDFFAKEGEGGRT